jgi:ribosomal protein S18 acetylase RimI-like enzyme
VSLATSIRRLRPADAQDYRALMLEAYERHPAAFTSSAEERGALPLSWWEARLAEAPDAPDLVLGGFAGATLAGAAGMSFETRVKARHKATLFGMYVQPAFRQLGLGAQLVAAALASARERDGVGLVQLTVTSGNRNAQALYERAGFLPFGIEPYAVAVAGGYVSKVHMWCNLGLDPAHSLA